jgi:hypothetical protein
MLKVRDLIEILETADPNSIVILACDAEGNGYSPVVEEYSTGVYIPDTTWSGEFYSAPDESACFDSEDQEQYDDFEQLGIKAIVLYPVN